MNATKHALVGTGRFQWNAGAWFGSSIGSSAWMLVTSCFLLVNGQAFLASLPATIFALILLGSTILWSRRDSIFPFSALMTLLALIAVSFPVVWCVVQSYGSPSTLTAMNWPESPWIRLLVIAIVPTAMIWFFVLEKSGTTERAKIKPDSNAVAEQSGQPEPSITRNLRS